MAFRADLYVGHRVWRDGSGATSQGGLIDNHDADFVQALIEEDVTEGVTLSEERVLRTELIQTTGT
jgi:hypothetical protein